MKTALDQSTAIHKLLNVPAVTSVIAGKLYKTDRATNSRAEDVVVMSLALGDGSRQFGVALVNIHVNDVEIAGRTGKFADTARMKLLSDIIVPLLEETDGDDFALWVDQTQVVSEPEIEQHYLNLRVEVRMYNFN